MSLVSLSNVPFEPGYDRVVRLDFPERVRGVRSIRVGSRPGRVRVEAGDDAAWEFDPAGRLIVAQEDAVSLHATFDGRIWGHRVVGHGKDRRLVPQPGPTDPREWLESVHGRIRRWLGVDSDGVWLRGAGGSAVDFARSALALAAARSPAILRTEVNRAQRVWRQIPVLPPDQYESLVLQISEGCPWDRCRFCSLYRDVPYRERTLAEIERHLDEVLLYVGASASRVRRIFLGQANALLRDTEELLQIFDLIRRRIPLPADDLKGPDRRIWLAEHTPSAEGFYAFVDAFHRTRPVAEWEQLREAGLRRVYIGLESGDAERLRELGKPLDPGRAIAQVEELHAAALPVAVILLTGIATPEHEARHRQKSAEVLRRMQLRKGDQVYLSPLFHPGGAALEKLAVSREQVDGAGPELARMREELRPCVGPGVPIANYNLDQLAARTPRG